jgi:stage V sporulation protein G
VAAALGFEGDIWGETMEITEVRTFPHDDRKLKAFASVTFDGCFVVKGLKIIEGKKGRFVAMPSRRKRGGIYEDVAHPLNSEMREYVEKMVLSKYNEDMEARKREGTTETYSEDE